MGVKMRMYTFKVGKIHEGIVTVKNDEGKDVVFLGDTNTERSRCAKVELDKNNPAENVNGIIKFAYPKKISDKRIVLTLPMRGDNKALVRVNTGSVSGEVKSIGRWVPNKGNPQIRVQANGSHEDGPIFCDDLVAMAHGDSITVYPEGETVGYEVFNQYGIVKCYREKTAEPAPEEGPAAA